MTGMGQWVATSGLGNVTQRHDHLLRACLALAPLLRGGVSGVFPDF